MFLAMIVWLVMTVFPALNTMAVFFTVVVAVLTGGLLFFSLVTEGEWWEGTKPLFKNLKWALPLVILLHLVPSEKTAWYMVGAYATQTVVQSEAGKELASDSLDVLKSLIKKSKQYIDEADLKDAPKAKDQQPKGEKA